MVKIVASWRGLLVPLSVVVLIVVVSLFAAASRQFSVFTMANSSLPMDNAGECIPCHVCRDGMAKATGGYHYKCMAKGCEFHAKYDSATGIVTFW